MTLDRGIRSLLLAVGAVVFVPSLFAQQTGSIRGTVTTDGMPLPGVTVEARSAVLPQPRTATTDGNGVYRLPVLPPAAYTLTFSLSGMQTRTTSVRVNLNQETVADAQLGVETISESITVTAETPLVDQSSAEVKSVVSEQLIDQVPVGQEYRDLLKLAPAVQVNEATVRGPSAGGSEQDNVYQFDGVNVTLPLFGTLAAEPSTQDIAQVSIIKGGARAVDFNRSAGFTIDSVSKSGTSEWSGDVKYQLQSDAMTSELVSGSASRFDEDKTWASAGIGGPILRDLLFFYGSYYRPTRHRENVSNLYGEVPDYESERNEYFGKVTFTPAGNILLHGSYRDSSRSELFASVGSTEASTAAVTGGSDQTIGILEGSWVISDRSFATLKYTDYGLETSSIPNLLLDVVPSVATGTRLDIDNLDRMGRIAVPSVFSNPSGNQVRFNEFVRPFIERYGFLRDGVRTGGGIVGAASQLNDQDFFRESAQVAYDITLGRGITHDIHVGYQWSNDREDLARASNGWGNISVIGGNANCPSNTACAGQPVYFQAEFQRSTEGTIGRQTIRSELASSNIEVNDTIQWGNWALNAGILVSNDILYGQGLREDSSTVSGYVSAPGNKYKMYEIGWEKQIQPRLGATWAYNGTDTIYASYARYNPAASSLPRAASWDRNTLGLVTQAYFDAEGDLIGSRQLASSSGKLFVEDMDPRSTDEYMIGTAQQFSTRWSARAYARHRYSTNFWEDVPNTARVNFEPPPEIPRELYIPDLSQRIAQIGSGSNYVIAEMDGAFTKYYEVTLESDYRQGNAVVRGTYTWSQYYGNFDQDNTSSVSYDFAQFIGSSIIADGAGRQIWDNKYGWLHGDRRHLLKVYGFYNLPWNASAGAFALYQSGHPWEAQSWEPYQHLTTNRSDSNRFAEPAGSRRTEGHYQLDLNYTQSVPIAGLNLQLIGDLFNVFDRQTGYSPQPGVHSALFGQPRIYHSPRRFQIAARLQF